MRGLKVRAGAVNKILHMNKRWEIRSTKCKLGLIYFVQTKGNTDSARVRIKLNIPRIVDINSVASFQGITVGEYLLNNEHMHVMSEEDYKRASEYKKVYAWVLEDVEEMDVAINSKEQRWIKDVEMKMAL